ncbi:hypothetical protein MKX03_021663 [Papaver bracteatum]|nr:hypothetical protein MKX03_021663 [Papaver bracteatum]
MLNKFSGSGTERGGGDAYLVLNRQIKIFTSNFRPQHPAAHDVSRSLLEMNIEVVEREEPHIGSLDRGIEKLIDETERKDNWVDPKWRSIRSIISHSHDLYQEMGAFGKTGELRDRGTCFPPFLLRLENRVNGEWQKGRKYTYRVTHYDLRRRLTHVYVMQVVVDPIYVSTMAQEHSYSLAVERLLNFKVPLRAQYIRVLFREITRISNHSVASTTHDMDVGASTPFLWASEEWEKLLEFHKRVPGARMHASFIQTGGVAQDMPLVLCRDIDSFTQQFVSQTKDWGFNGVMLRGSGVCWVSRREVPYDVHDQSDPNVPVGTRGDRYDRYNVCIEEMRQTDDLKICPPSRIRMKLSMESLIHHFEPYTEGFPIPSPSTYTAVEAPKEEFGVFRVSKGSNHPYHYKIRAPGYAHSQGLDFMSKHHMPADIVTIISNQDIVSVFVDR